MKHLNPQSLITAMLIMIVVHSPALSHNDVGSSGLNTMPSARIVLGALDIRLTPALLTAHGITFSTAAEVALDENANLYLRARALSGAAMVGGEAAHTLLIELARSEDHIELRRQAIISLSKVFGRQTPRQVALELSALIAVCPETLHERIQREVDWLDTLPEPSAERTHPTDAQVIHTPPSPSPLTPQTQR